MQHTLFCTISLITTCLDLSGSSSGAHLLHTYNYQTVAHIQIFLQFGKFDKINFDKVNFCAKTPIYLKFNYIYLHL
jgi:hypothetical protein